ncbi:hypothetical protein NE619_17805 [Anaerovorax odorimutans]|uniref:DUF3533 domain-containing protein n=1 Tax=Anaerovorax odorimutans TaxID=109327 RepID=A0ABT1RTP7_9FIRM|nr:hypothetical protein [Anaerovorax odorimutans]MCQ4638587.1 hypothetical protein [Anaerovorax odorimutans]
MFDKLGKRKYILPIIGVIVICCVMSLVLYPMLNAQAKNVPLAIVSLDKGASTPKGEMNIGSQIVEKITNTAGSDDKDAVIEWTKLKNQAAVDKALEENVYYGALIIPEDFTIQQAAAQSGKDTVPTVKLLINQGKNTMLASTIQTALTSMVDQMAMKAEVKVVHPVSSNGGALSALMGVQMTVMPLFMMSMIAAVLLFLATRSLRDSFEKKKALGLTLIYAVGLSFLVSWGTIFSASVFGNIDMPVATVMLFLWLASFSVIMLIFGALSVTFPLGVTVLLLVFACGMSSAMIAPEMLPSFWSNWIYPWVPQHYIGDGMREILYMNGSVWNTGSLALISTAGIGIVLAIIGTYMPRKIMDNKIAENM